MEATGPSATPGPGTSSRSVSQRRAFRDEQGRRKGPIHEANILLIVCTTLSGQAYPEGMPMWDLAGSCLILIRGA